MAEFCFPNWQTEVRDSELRHERSTKTWLAIRNKNIVEIRIDEHRQPIFGSKLKIKTKKNERRLKTVLLTLETNLCIRLILGRSLAKSEVFISERSTIDLVAELCLPEAALCSDPKSLSLVGMSNWLKISLSMVILLVMMSITVFLRTRRSSISSFIFFSNKILFHSISFKRAVSTSVSISWFRLLMSVWMCSGSADIVSFMKPSMSLLYSARFVSRSKRKLRT